MRRGNVGVEPGNEQVLTGQETRPVRSTLFQRSEPRCSWSAPLLSGGVLGGPSGAVPVCWVNALLPRPRSKQGGKAKKKRRRRRRIPEGLNEREMRLRKEFITLVTEARGETSLCIE